MCRVLGLLRQSPELAIFALQELMQGNARWQESNSCTVETLTLATLLLQIELHPGCTKENSPQHLIGDQKTS